MRVPSELSGTQDGLRDRFCRGSMGSVVLSRGRCVCIPQDLSTKLYQVKPHSPVFGTPETSLEQESQAISCPSWPHWGLTPEPVIVTLAYMDDLGHQSFLGG